HGAPPRGSLALAAYERADFRICRGVERAHLAGRGGACDPLFEFVRRDFLPRRGARELWAFARDENRETFDEPERRAPVAARGARRVAHAEVLARKRQTIAGCGSFDCGLRIADCGFFRRKL